MTNTIKSIYKSYKNIILISLLSIPIGIAVGTIDALFGTVLLKITDFRDAYPLYLIPFLALSGILIVFVYNKLGKNSIKGMNLIFEAGHGYEDNIPLRLIPLVISGTWLTHLFGGSAGREGVAVQIGAALSHITGKKLHFKNSHDIFIVTGISAGFSGLFGTPIAAVFFAIEILTAGTLKYTALLPAFISAFTSSTVAGMWGLEKFKFPLSLTSEIDVILFVKLAGLGILFGITGGAFACCLKSAKKLAGDKLKNPILRIALIGAVLSILFILLYKGRYSGLGTNLINTGLNGGEIYSYDWILKFILTILTLAAGFQGGEVTPLFSIGTALGVTLSGFFNIPFELAAALGYAGVFCGATNTYFAPLFIGAEVFGYSYIPHFFIVCTAAYVFNMNKSIYTLQKINQ